MYLLLFTTRTHFHVLLPFIFRHTYYTGDDHVGSRVILSQSCTYPCVCVRPPLKETDPLVRASVTLRSWYNNDVNTVSPQAKTKIHTHLSLSLDISVSPLTATSASTLVLSQRGNQDDLKMFKHEHVLLRSTRHCHKGQQHKSGLDISRSLDVTHIFTSQLVDQSQQKRNHVLRFEQSVSFQTVLLMTLSCYIQRLTRSIFE